MESRFQLGDGRQVEVRLDGQPRSVGRSSSNDLVLEDPSVSRRHARLLFQDGRLYIEDLVSTSGTFLNGVRIPAKRATEIRPGDEIRLGELSMVLSQPVDPSEAETRFVDISALYAGNPQSDATGVLPKAAITSHEIPFPRTASQPRVRLGGAAASADLSRNAQAPPLAAPSRSAPPVSPAISSPRVPSSHPHVSAAGVVDRITSSQAPAQRSVAVPENTDLMLAWFLSLVFCLLAGVVATQFVAIVGLIASVFLAARVSRDRSILARHNVTVSGSYPFLVFLLWAIALPAYVLDRRKAIQKAGRA